MVGAGAVGSLFGGYLSHAGNEVILIGRGEHIQTMRKRGLIIRNKADFVVKPRAEDAIDQVKGPFDLILITVKAYDTRQAVLDIGELIKDKTPVLFLQNGLGTEETVAKIVEKPMRGITMNGAFLPEPGLIIHTGEGETVIGEQDGSVTPRVRAVANTFVNAGLNTGVTKTIRGTVWLKTLVNSGINPIGALTGMRNGELIQVASLKNLMRKTVEEGAKVAEKNGVYLEEDPISLTMKTAELTKNNKNSMLQDLLKKRRTEIDFINGAISEYGGRSGVPTPINIVLTELIKGLEQKNTNR